MRYVLKQKFWSWGDDFMIRDERGTDLFRVDGRAFSWGDKLSFQDTGGRELAFIRQKLLSWGPTYEIERDGALLARIFHALLASDPTRCAWIKSTDSTVLAIRAKCKTPSGFAFSPHRTHAHASSPLVRRPTSGKGRRKHEICGLAVVKKELFTFFRCRFTVDVPGPDDLEARGDFLDTNTRSSAAARPWPA